VTALRWCCLSLYKNVRLIALDLDGTLLNDAKELTERTQRALEAASRSGIEVVLSTGRPVTALPQEVAHFPYIKYALTADGARIENLRTGELLFEGLIPKEMVKPIYDIFDDYDVIEEIYIKGQGYISERDIDHLEEYTTNPAHAAYARRTRKRVKDIHDLLDQDIDKAHALFKSFEDREDAMRRIREIADLELCDAFPINLEVSAPGINKGEGLKILGEKLGIETKDMMAFGDSNNDAAMLQTAGVAVVMDNAYESVKEIADMIAPSNEEDGVAAVIEQMLE